MSANTVTEHLPESNAPEIWRVELLTKHIDRNEESILYFFDEESLEIFQEDIDACNRQREIKKIISRINKYQLVCAQNTGK